MTKKGVQEEEELHTAAEQSSTSKLKGLTGHDERRRWRSKSCSEGAQGAQARTEEVKRVDNKVEKRIKDLPGGRLGGRLQCMPGGVPLGRKTSAAAPPPRDSEPAQHCQWQPPYNPNETKPNTTLLCAFR